MQCPFRGASKQSHQPRSSCSEILCSPWMRHPWQMPTMQWSRRPVWFSLYRFLSTSLKGLFECAWRAGSFRHQTNFAPVDDLRIHPASISWLAVQWCQSDCWRSSWQHQRPALGQESYQMLEPPGFLSTIKFMGLTWITYELRANQCKSFQIIDSNWLIDDWLIHDLLVELCWIALMLPLQELAAQASKPPFSVSAFGAMLPLGGSKLSTRIHQASRIL